MEREQIIKALECCISGDDCTICPLCDEQSCPCVLNENALALIKELTEDLHATRTEFERKCASLNEENERLTSNLVEQSAENIMLIGENKRLSRRIGFDIGAIRADTVRKMQERLKAESFIVAPETNLGAVVLASDIDRVAEKMLEDVK